MQNITNYIFVIPRVELSTGKAFNPCPPGWQKHFDPLRDYFNIKENWARPDDPARSRLYTPENADLNKARLLRWNKTSMQDERSEAKQSIHDYICTSIEQGNIPDSQDVITALQSAGLQITRAGKDYLTVQDPDSGEKLRLKGTIYGKDWKYTNRLDRPYILEDEEEDRTRTANNREHNTETIQHPQEILVVRELVEIIKKRSLYNRKRYPQRIRQLGEQLLYPLSESPPNNEFQHMVSDIADNHRNSAEWHGATDILQIQATELARRNSKPENDSPTITNSSDHVGTRNMGTRALSERKQAIYNPARGQFNRNMDSRRQERLSTEITGGRN